MRTLPFTRWIANAAARFTRRRIDCSGETFERPRRDAAPRRDAGSFGGRGLPVRPQPSDYRQLGRAQSPAVLDAGFPRLASIGRIFGTGPLPS